MEVCFESKISENIAAASQASFDDDFLRDGAFMQEDDALPHQDSEDSSVPMVDVLPDDYVDQFLDQLAAISGDGVSRALGEEESILSSLGDPPSLPVPPLPLAHADAAINDETSSDSQGDSDEQSFLTQMSDQPVAAGQLKCDCEGCNLVTSCGACKQCRKGLCCYCSCCSYQQLDKLKEAILQLTEARMNHTPEFKVDDTVSCRKGVRFKRQIHLYAQPYLSGQVVRWTHILHGKRTSKRNQVQCAP